MHSYKQYWYIMLSLHFLTLSDLSYINNSGQNSIQIGDKSMTIKKALLWVSFWVGISLLFNTGVWLFEGPKKALEFFGDMSLSWVWAWTTSLSPPHFQQFRHSTDYQRRALNYGIIGAVVLRFIFIMLGVAVVNRFEWVLYIFGALLLFSGYKMFFQDEEEKKDFSDSKLLKILGKIIR